MGLPTIELELAGVNRALRRFEGATAKQADRLLKRTAVKFIRVVVPLTPVDTGFLRAGWTALARVAVRGPAVQARRVTEARRAAQRALTIQPGLIVLVNPAEYAFFVEEGTRFMQGQHMAAQALNQVAAELRAVRFE